LLDEHVAGMQIIVNDIPIVKILDGGEHLPG
jgi:hypothetical protein